MKRILHLALYPSALLFLLLIWYLLSQGCGEDVIPDPLSTLKAFAAMAANDEFVHSFYVSLMRLSAALLLSALIAYPAGLWLGLSARADLICAPLLYLTYPIPKIVLLPVFFLLLGLGDLSRISLIALSCIYQIAMIVRAAAKRLPKAYTDSMKFMGGSKLDCLINVWLPATLPDFLTSMRVATGTAVAVLFLAESFATEAGLGFMIMDAWGIGDVTTMFCAMIGISLLGLIFYISFALLEKILCPWYQKG